MPDMPETPIGVLCDVASVLKALSALCDDPPDDFPAEGVGVICRWAAERVEHVAGPMLDAAL